MSSDKKINIKLRTGVVFVCASLFIFVLTGPLVLNVNSSERMVFLPGTVGVWRPIFMGGVVLSFAYGVGMLIAALWERRGS